MEGSAAREALGWLHGLGLVLDGPMPEEGLPASTVLLSRGGRQYTVDLMSRPSMSLADVLHAVRQPRECPLLLLGPRINERSADGFRRAGINYVDAAGNAYIQLDGLLLDVRGRRTRKGAAGVVRETPTRPANLFSAKRAQVVFALLVWPELAEAPLRHISQAACVSLGQVSQTLSLLEEHGYKEVLGTKGLRRREELRDGWLWAYPQGLGLATRIKELVGDISHIESAGSDVTLSGESAVPELLRPETVTIYVEDLLPSLVVANRWRPSAKPNVFIRHKFWRDPRSDDRHIARALAPPLLIYADLLAAREARQIEAAEHFMGGHGPF